MVVFAEGMLTLLVVLAAVEIKYEATDSEAHLHYFSCYCILRSGALPRCRWPPRVGSTLENHEGFCFMSISLNSPHEREALLFLVCGG